MLKKSLLPLLLLAAGTGVAAPKISTETLLRCGPMNSKPVIDGAISTQEANASSPNYGFMNSKTKMMSLRYGMFYFGYTDEGIYFAARASIPPLPQRLTEQDTLQLLLLPPGAKKAFEFTITPSGKHNLPKGGKAAVRKLSGVVDYGIECMETEAFIPFSALGIKKMEDGKVWGLQMIRNFQAQPETALWHWSLNPKDMGTFIPDAQMPVCGVNNFGFKEFQRPNANYQFTFQFNNPTAKKVSLDCNSILYYGQGTAKLDDKPEESLGIKKKEFKRESILNAKDRQIHSNLVYNIWPGTVNTLICNFSADGKPVYRRTIRWDYAKGEKWVDAAGLPSIQSAFYPSFNNRLLVKLNRNKTRRMVEGKITVEDSKGKVWYTYKPKVEGYLRNFELDTHLPKLPVGKYFVRFTGKEKSGKVYTDERTFEIAKFPWQGTNVGMENVIVPPFKPLKVKGNEVHALMTGYRAGNGIWDAVYAEGENILAGPVELIINGQKFKTGKPQIIMKEGYRVMIQIPASWNDLKLTILQDYDYDGFSMVTFKFDPKKTVKVNSLVLNIPLKDKYVTLLNYTRRANNKRHGPSPNLFVPKGNGVVWDSVKESGPCPRYPAPIQPYFWFGGPKKGFCWLSESIRHWSIDKRSSIQTLTRKGDTITFSVNIVNKPVEWSKAFEIKMAFQPTPVKPVFEEFRDSAEHMFIYLKPKNAKGVSMLYNMSVGTFSKTNPTYPNNDDSLVRYILNSIGKETDKKAYAKLTNEYFKRNRRWLEDRGYAADVLRHEWGIWWRRAGMKYLSCYHNPMLISCFWPEWEMYKAEWQAHPYPRENFFNSYGCYQTKSRNDFLLYRARNESRKGYSGIYYDCFHEGGTYNYIVNEGAYKKPDGEIQYSLTQVLGWREIIKRTATMLYVENNLVAGQRPWVDIHDTLGQIIPVCSFATSTITFERGAAGGEFQDRMKEGYVLADMLGLQSGCFPIPIVTTHPGNMARKERELESLFAVMCAYGFFHPMDQGIIYRKWFDDAWNAVFDFGFGKPGNKQYFYYNEEKMPITHNGKNVRVNLSVKKDSALIMAGNLGDKETLTFDASGLGWKNCEFFDAVTNKSLGKGNTLKWTIERRRHALIRVDKK